VRTLTRLSRYVALEGGLIATGLDGETSHPVIQEPQPRFGGVFLLAASEASE